MKFRLNARGEKSISAVIGNMKSYRASEDEEYVG
jgi:hypothetical protein